MLWAECEPSFSPVSADEAVAERESETAFGI